MDKEKKYVGENPTNDVIINEESEYTLRASEDTRTHRLSKRDKKNLAIIGGLLLMYVVLLIYNVLR